jgi:hypothetical protein
MTGGGGSTAMGSSGVTGSGDGVTAIERRDSYRPPAMTSIRLCRSCGRDDVHPALQPGRHGQRLGRLVDVSGPPRLALGLGGHPALDRPGAARQASADLDELRGLGVGDPGDLGVDPGRAALAAAARGAVIDVGGTELASRDGRLAVVADTADAHRRRRGPPPVRLATRFPSRTAGMTGAGRGAALTRSIAARIAVADAAELRARPSSRRRPGRGTWRSREVVDLAVEDRDLDDLLDDLGLLVRLRSTRKPFELADPLAELAGSFAFACSTVAASWSRSASTSTGASAFGWIRFSPSFGVDAESNVDRRRNATWRRMSSQSGLQTHAVPSGRTGRLERISCCSSPDEWYGSTP